VSGRAGNITRPSVPEAPSRTAPVSVLVTVTCASLTIAPDWSVTTTATDALSGDCAAAGAIAQKSVITTTRTFFNISPDHGGPERPAYTRRPCRRV